MNRQRHRGRRWARAQGWLLAGWLAFGCWGAAEADRIDLAGYYKNLLSVTDVRDNYQDLGVTTKDVAVDEFQRVRLKVDAAPWEPVEVRVHYELRAVGGETERIRGRVESAPFDAMPSVILGGPERTRFLDLEREIHDGDAWTVSHGLDRLLARWVSDRFDFIMGRQAVSWGVGRIWTPADLFAGFAPNEIDRDEKAGVDVVRGIWSPTFDSALDVIAEPLDDEPYAMDPDRSSLALRASTHLGEYDLAGLGGRIAGDGVVGGSFSGYLADAGFRGEFVFTHVREEDQRDYARWLLSLDYGFPVRWNPYAAVEYLYNGLGTDDREAYLERLRISSVQRAFSRGNAFNIGRHYLGATLSVTPSALWSLQSTTLVNLLDGSVLEYASATRSLHDNLDLLLGINAALGEPGTEFGGFSAEQAGFDFATPDFFFTFLKWYF